MERVFKALADGRRRRILDLLRERGGRTLGELCARFPRLSRFAVMKHLRVLERAGLVAVRREGRLARHHLNAVPLQRIAERWLSRYSAAVASAMLALQGRIESEGTPWRRRGTSTRSTSARRPSGSGRRSRASSSSAATTTTTAWRRS